MLNRSEQFTSDERGFLPAQKPTWCRQAVDSLKPWRYRPAWRRPTSGKQVPSVLRKTRFDARHRGTHTGVWSYLVERKRRRPGWNWIAWHRGVLFVGREAAGSRKYEVFLLCYESIERSLLCRHRGLHEETCWFHRLPIESGKQRLKRPP